MKKRTFRNTCLRIIKWIMYFYAFNSIQELGPQFLVWGTVKSSLI